MLHWINVSAEELEGLVSDGPRQASPATCSAWFEVQPGPSRASTLEERPGLACLSPSSPASARSSCVPGAQDLGVHQ